MRTVLSALVAGTLGITGCGGDGYSSSSSTTGGTQAGLQTIADDEAFYTEVRGELVAQQRAGSLVSNGAGDNGSSVSAIPLAGVIATGSTQEAGVSEVDRVKTDGARLYILHTDLVGRELLPGEELPDDGSGETPMIFEERTSLRIVGIDQSGADATPVAELGLDYPGGNFAGLYLHESSAGTSIVIPLAAAARYWQDWGNLEYTGSGTVPGHLGWNELRRPSRLSEHTGTLRVVSFAPDQATADSPMIVSLLDATANGALPVIGSLPGSDRPAELGAPGIELYASRFVDDTLYLVSSREGDTLQVVDLAIVSAPVFAGSLATTGIIDQLFPLDAGYLLGIGQDASNAEAVDVTTGTPDDTGAPGRIGNDETGGDASSGITVSLLNVSDPSAPVEVQTVNIGSNGATAAANNDLRAVTIQPANEAHPWRIAFGVEMPDGDDPLPLAGDPSATTSPFDEPGLHGFDVRTGTDARIDPIGVIDTALAGPPQVGVDYADRSVIIDNGVFYALVERNGNEQTALNPAPLA